MGIECNAKLVCGVKFDSLDDLEKALGTKEPFEGLDNGLTIESYLVDSWSGEGETIVGIEINEGEYSLSYLALVGVLFCNSKFANNFSISDARFHLFTQCL